MALPKPILPIFETTVPSTGQTLHFRQFTVREEKALVQAQETEDLKIIANAVKEVLTECIKEDIDVNDLALFDVEFLMTKIRSKSVGELIDLKMPCDADPSHNRTPHRLNLETLKVKIPEGHSTNIKLYGDVGVIMRYPSLNDLEKFETVDGIDAAVICVEQIYTDDEVFHAKDQTHEEVREFLTDLTAVQFEKIEQEFFNNMPVFEYEFEYSCNDCGHKHKKIIKGLANFFV